MLNLNLLLGIASKSQGLGKLAGCEVLRVRKDFGVSLLFHSAGQRTAAQEEYMASFNLHSESESRLPKSQAKANVYFIIRQLHPTAVADPSSQCKFGKFP